MKNLVVILLLLSSLMSFAQYDPEKVDKKAVNIYNKALLSAQDDNFKEAISLLQQAITIDNRYEDAYLSIAGMYGELKDYQNSITNYEKAKSIDSIYFLDYNLPYSINLAGVGKFQDALNAVDTFLTVPNLNETSVKAGEYRKRCYEFAI